MKVFLGLSGGVDSAVAAYLLKKQGYEVTCGFMRNWDSTANDDLLGNPTALNAICPQEQDYLDAKAVADKLGLPLLRIDFVKEYWDDVFSDLISEYRKGRTPNPDILCNKYIKFSKFYEYAQKNGFEYLATGHYAGIREIDGISYLTKAKDLNKDQSYFLDQIDRSLLDKIIFPLQQIDKPTVRKIAKELDLRSVENKKDSTGICFIGERRFKEFLQNYLPAKTGKLIDLETGEVKGEMAGVLYYTVGQRKGLMVGGKGGPWFVAGKDVDRNELFIVQGENNPWLVSDSCQVTNINWLVPDIPQGKKEVQAKFRYRQPDNPVTIEVNEKGVYVSYPQGIKAVAVGQQAVFYQDDICLGGGVIDEVYKRGKVLNEEMEKKLHA